MGIPASGGGFQEWLAAQGLAVGMCELPGSRRESPVDAAGSEVRQAPPHWRDWMNRTSQAASSKIRKNMTNALRERKVQGSHGAGNCISAGAIGWTRISRGLGAYPHTNKAIEIERIRTAKKRRIRFFIWLFFLPSFPRGGKFVQQSNLIQPEFPCRPCPRQYPGSCGRR